MHSCTTRRDGTGGSVSAAPSGSAGILPILWAHIRMRGAEGLTEATRAAVLGANHLAHRFAALFPS